MTAPRPPSPLDRAFFALVTRGWNAHKIASYESTLRKRDKEMSAEASHTFASIDTKATGLLTHTSMMIAGLGLIAPLVADSDFEVGIVIMEMAIYLLIALGCLRCLSVFHAYEFEAVDHVQDVRFTVFAFVPRSYSPWWCLRCCRFSIFGRRRKRHEVHVALAERASRNRRVAGRDRR
jgi:hypothetical protein